MNETDSIIQPNDPRRCHVLGSKFKVHYKIDYGGKSVLSITVTVAYYVDKYF